MAQNSKNGSLNKAGVAKEDEFYTKLTDIEKELRHYRDFFRGKTVFCNCDDPFESNFFKYFAMNFNSLGLKKLIATCYATSPIVYTQLNLFGDEEIVAMEESERKPYKIEITEVIDENGDGRIDLFDVEYLLRNHKNALTLLQGDGDFRSEECEALQEQADVIVTNPPFSLFREYIAQLVASEKWFIIIGSQNALTYKEVFPMLRDNKVWLGYNCGDMEFTVPDYYEPRATRYREENGVKYRSMGNICWYTNIDIPKRHENLLLYKVYSPEEYEKYDNYEAINVNKVVDIPCDFYGVMGVPITFMDKYNPKQFDIVGLIAGNIKGLAGITSSTGKDGPYINGKLKYGRILIKRKG
ncbi:adenine-specific methyltransferase EcoRI family protein [Anaerotignum sp.]|uniref:adenine-specific methyltransferase EcoRI family protein n=1 Tax=Anaerotignum sp. TaxID=2039241 RepID=UPI0033339DD8